MDKIEYEKPELKELDTDRGEGLCLEGSADLEWCGPGAVAGAMCSEGAAASG